MKYGYARVSTKDQNLDLQLDALKKENCERIFTDIASGVKKDRPELEKLLNEVRKDDVIVIWKLDRLGRSLIHLVNLVYTLESKGVGLKSLSDPIDTTNPQGKLIFNIFASLAEFEKDIIRERTKAGLSAARARGRLGGRPKGLSKEAQSKACAAETLYNERKLTVLEICNQLSISKATLYSYLRSRNVPIGDPTKSNTKSFSKRKPPVEEKFLEVELYLVIENNSKFVRGKGKSKRNIEDYILPEFNMKRIKNCDYKYILTIPYTDEEDLDSTIEGLFNQIHETADLRDGFAEVSITPLDENDERWWD